MYVYGTCLFYVCCSDCVGVCGNVCCVVVSVGSIYRLKYFCHFFKSLQSVYTIARSLMNRVIIILIFFYNQATRSKVTTIIVRNFFSSSQIH